MKQLLYNIKQFFLWLSTPIQIYLQRAGNQEPLMTDEQVSNIMERIEPGDIILSYECGRPTSRLIKGFYDHASIVNAKYKVTEAVGNRYKLIDGKKVNTGGVRECSLPTFLLKKDAIAVIRPVYKGLDGKVTTLINRLAAASAISYHGLPYDYRFKIGKEAVYCSELEYLCYREHDTSFMSEIGPQDELLPMYYYERTISHTVGQPEFIVLIEYRNEN